MRLHFRREKGFTLIELLIVVAIIGILAAIAIPNMLLALQRSKQKRTMADIRVIALAWEARSTDVNGYNAAGWTALPEVAISDLNEALIPTYMRSFPTLDGWGNAYSVRANAAFGDASIATQYQVASYGRNGVAEFDTPAGPTTAFDCDIVMMNGEFLVWPAGTQTGSPQSSP